MAMRVAREDVCTRFIAQGGISLRGGNMGKYEELDKTLSEQYQESVRRYNTSAPGIGDEKLYKNNRDMHQLKEREAHTLREMQACAPVSERPKIDRTLANTEQEAKGYGERADH